jgi:MarR family transcriptional regulator, organic hydroperoxide resistance regulator
MGVQLYMALYRTFHAQKNRIRPGMTEIGLSPGQPKVLGYLTRQDGCMQKDIAAALDIEPATVSQILTNMAQDGLIRRSCPAERKRAESVYITEKGQEVYEKWQRLCHEVEKAALDGFAESEQEQFIGYLCRMYRNLSGKELE